MAINRWGWGQRPTNPPPGQDDVIDQLLKMLRGLKMWRQSWQQMTGATNQQGQQVVSPGGMTAPLRQWGSQVGTALKQKVQTPFYKWWGWGNK